MKYETLPKKQIVSFFIENRERAFSVEELEAALSSIPQSTLYRVLGKLVEDGCIKKCPSSSRSVLYQYSDKENCPHHMHIRCLKCGKIEHLSDEDSARIERLIKGNLDFEVSNSSMLEGLCKECKRR